MLIHYRVLSLVLPVLGILIGCSSSSVTEHRIETEDIQTRLLHAGFSESESDESLGTGIIDYRRTMDDGVVIRATWCSAWAKVTVLAPQSAVRDVDRIEQAIRHAEETVDLIVAEPNALSGLYSDEHLVRVNSGINRTEHRIIAGVWSIQAVRYLSVAKNAGLATLASFTLQKSAESLP